MSDQKQAELKDTRVPYERAYFSSVPTRFTRVLRTNLFWQIWRFLVINIKMMRMISLSHSREKDD